MDVVLNWIWQGLVVATALSVMLRCLARARADVRYMVCASALVIVLAIPIGRALSPTDRSLQLAAQTIVAPVVSIPAAAWTSDAALLALWSLWIGVQVMRVSRAALRLRRARQSSRPLPIEVERRLSHWMRVREGGRRAPLVVSEDMGPAAVLGGGAPLIAIAPALVEHLPADELDRVVIHEWAHVQRRDDVVAMLQLLCRVVVGWHPAVWWIERHLHVEREVACDQAAVSITGSPKAYASCLLRLAELSAAPRIPLAASGVLSANSLRRRVTSIVSRQVMASTLWSRVWATSAIVTLAAVSATVGAFELVVAAVPHIERARPIPVVDVATLPRPAVTPESIPTPDVGREATTSNPVGVRSQAPPAVVLGTAPAQGVVSDAPVVPAEAASQPLPDLLPAGRIGLASSPLAAIEVGSRRSPTDGQPPWSVASDAGSALGRSSKDAGLATAAAFRRFGRRVAASF